MAEKVKYRRPGNGVLLSTEELASRLGEESRTIVTWRQRGIIPFIDAGYRTKRYKLEDVLHALGKRTIREV
jgi:hypothetical protein